MNVFFIFLVVAVAGFDCMEYARSISESTYMISKEEREMYLPNLCSTTSLCHSNPVLSSFDAFKHDVVRCYKTRMFNMDMNIFTAIRQNVTEYFDVRQERLIKVARYDALNYEAKDAMVAIIDISRLRDSYLREFQYSKSPILTGDIALLLEHNRRLYDVNSQHQIFNLRDIINTTLTHVSSAIDWQRRLDAAYADLKEVLERLDEKESEFNIVSTMIKKSVVLSLLKIMS
jgi:hypothetical protein|tara:strand:+ start:117 stop:809 length:693 start_codon:yes stop_codon:yes gene_type:complete